MAARATVIVPRAFSDVIDEINAEFILLWKKNDRESVAKALGLGWDEYLAFVIELNDLKQGKVHPADRLRFVATTPEGSVYVLAIGQWRVAFLEDPSSDTWTLSYSEKIWSDLVAAFQL